MIKVKRMTLRDYNELVEILGAEAKALEVRVPSTDQNASFKGVYTNRGRNEAAVAWPIDRPLLAQQDYADKYSCGFPVESFSNHDKKNGGLH